MFPDFAPTAPTQSVATYTLVTLILIFRPFHCSLNDRTFPRQIDHYEPTFYRAETLIPTKGAARPCLLPSRRNKAV